MIKLKCIKDITLPFDSDVLLFKKGKTYECKKKISYGFMIMSEWNNTELLLHPEDLKRCFSRIDLLLKVKIL